MSASAQATIRFGRRSEKRGLVLLVVLVMVVLLSLLAASYTFMVQANLRAVITDQQQFQARVAAQSGIERAVVLLRASKNDPSKWYDNPQVFHGALLYSDAKEGVSNELPQRDTFDPNAPAAWRFNVVAPNLDNRATVRYGLTDECSKLNLNTATGEQLRRFFQLAIPQDSAHPWDINVLVDSLLDWREQGDTPRANGAKDEYYQGLRPPYMCKRQRFSTVEELLLVKGFNGWILYGEDYNRNGMLDANEDDGNASFPPDNADGVLFPGIAPYLTLWSNEMNASADGRPRINLNMKDAQELQTAMEAEFRPEITNYVVQVRNSGMQFNSIMNLIPAPPPDEEAEETKKPASQPTSRPSTTSQPSSQPSGGISAGGQKGTSDQNPTTSAPSTKAPVYKDLTSTPPPGTYEDLPQIWDRLTVNASPFMAGRINVSTASAPVIATIEELSTDEVMAIGAARATLQPQERMTPAWLLTRHAITENRFRQILDKITTHSSVFQIESVGFADHVGVVDRKSVILEMRGPMPQVLYSRNLNSLGPAYQPHTQDQRVAAQGIK